MATWEILNLFPLQIMFGLLHIFNFMNVKKYLLLYSFCTSSFTLEYGKKVFQKRKIALVSYTIVTSKIKLYHDIPAAYEMIKQDVSRMFNVLKYMCTKNWNQCPLVARIANHRYDGLCSFNAWSDNGTSERGKLEKVLQLLR